MAFPKDFLWGGATAANQYEALQKDSFYWYKKVIETHGRDLD